MNFEKESIVIVDEHLIIRETVGYDFISKIELEDLPTVLNFLQVIWNYQKMCDALNKENNNC